MMKTAKTIRMTAALCALLLTLTGCVSVTDYSAPDPASTAVTTEEELTNPPAPADETTAEETTAMTNPPAPAEEETTEAPTDPVTDPPAPAEITAPPAPAEEGGPSVSEAKTLLNALNMIDRIGACAIATDGADTYAADGETYCKVTESGFSTTADVKAYMEQYLTQTLITERYSGILGGDTPMCMDVDGALYIRQLARGGGFAFSEKDPVIEKTSEDGYSVLAEYDNFGASETMDVGVVKDGGAWKIDRVTFGM